MMEHLMDLVNWITNLSWWEILVFWFLGGLVINNAYEFLLPEAHWARVYRRSTRYLWGCAQRAAQEAREHPMPPKVERPEGTPALRSER